MPLQSANVLVDADAFNLIRGNAASWKAQAQNASAALAAGTVNTDFIFSMLNVLNQLITALNSWSGTAGLNTYATNQGYPTTMTTDITAVVNAAQACINWVVTNFPASGGFLQAQKLNADGTRTPATFTSAQTAPLQTLLNTLAGTIT